MGQSVPSGGTPLMRPSAGLITQGRDHLFVAFVLCFITLVLSCGWTDQRLVANEG